MNINISPIYISNSHAERTQNIINTSLINKKQSVNDIYKLTHDNISFTGIILRDAKKRSEIAKLSKLFIVSIGDNTPNSDSIFFKLIEKLLSKVASIPIMHDVNVENRITKIACQNNKIVGGFSLTIDPEDKTGHINFLTLSNKLKHTKSGINCLLEMGNSIGETARKNNLKELTWDTHPSNRLALKTFGHLNPQKIYSSYTSSPYMTFRISTDNFINRINQLSKNYKKMAD